LRKRSDFVIRHPTSHPEEKVETKITFFCHPEKKVEVEVEVEVQVFVSVFLLR
jgi:hypothetical protein